MAIDLRKCRLCLQPKAIELPKRRLLTLGDQSAYDIITLGDQSAYDRLNWYCNSGRAYVSDLNATFSEIWTMNRSKNDESNLAKHTLYPQDLAIKQNQLESTRLNCLVCICVYIFVDSTARLQPKN